MSPGPCQSHSHLLNSRTQCTVPLLGPVIGSLNSKSYHKICCEALWTHSVNQVLSLSIFTESSLVSKKFSLIPSPFIYTHTPDFLSLRSRVFDASNMCKLGPACHLSLMLNTHWFLELLVTLTSRCATAGY